MAQLVQLKSRIKAVETIKKITHAMRLIAMSSHARLKNREALLVEYRQELSTLLASLLAKTNHHDTQSQHIASSRELLVVISSHKGLCGTFNSALCKYVDKHFAKSTIIDCITIGKRADDHIKAIGLPIVRNLPSLSASSLAIVTHDLHKLITELQSQYHAVNVVSNIPVSFFVQRPTVTHLLPVPAIDTTSALDLDRYIWPVTPEVVVTALMDQYIASNIQTILYQSLIAETAARFQSMDSANRNAVDLLQLMQRQYNKLRQAKITKELIELTSGFIQQQ
ncbi:F0F1 ATP synthase subunit gamma [Candidatus Dependentiae bacterium]|nr:F0F1 ATP synthase subunit gamma [Candidatus Dependentiae bacterium]